MVLFVGLINVVRAAVPVMPGRSERLADRFTTDLADAPTLFAPIQIAVAAAMMFFALIVALMGWLLVLGGVRIVFRAELRTFQLVAAALAAVRCCGSVFKTTGPERTDGLRDLAICMRGVRKALRRAHRARGTLPLRGDRQKEARAHIRQVVQCLNDAEKQIDATGDQALPQLVDHLSRIADQYADGRLGALLDEESLKNYQPGPDWEALRLACLALVMAIGAAATGFLALSDPVALVVIFSVGVLGVALLYGKNLKHGLSFLSLWRPG
ncbi:hypothetical protein OG458_42615 (plasmid) [Streptomyces sp. NBC_01281]|uniref:hypothetical protein n=1 Tax=Streptomyces sp. NBC_01281 TaxID=2903811 RepID=UPI002E0DCDE8|nr:hypothetical protein OG458_42615 [Streptomyces sp. NBC_01281]